VGKPGNTGIKRVIQAAGYSWQGLRQAWRYESAFRQELTICLLLVPCAFVVGQSAVEVALLIGMLGLVLITELLNSAIEAVVDRIGEEHHQLAGRAKDMGSAAVFVSLVLVAAVWLIVGASNYL